MTIRSQCSGVWLLALTLCAAALVIPGCSGCWRSTARSQSQQDEKDKDKSEPDKEKRKPDFEFQDGQRKGLVVLPGGETSGVKPGHWMSVSQPVKANNYDFSGELTSAAVDNNRRPLQLERTAYRLQMARPAALPKGQLKHLEMDVFVPRRPGRGGTRPTLLARLNSRGGGPAVMEFIEPTTTMEPYQYYLVVLARVPDSYGYLKVMDSVRPPRGSFGGPLMHYRVVTPKLDGQVPLPSNPLMWTSIAYLVWDGIDPGLLTLDQQNAMVDWLHWGGQLIVSGPGSLETLSGSFLARHLPAFPGETQKLSQQHFEELNQFTLPGPDGERTELAINPRQPPEGLALRLQPGGRYVPTTGGLLAEGQVGRGRIAVTSFALTQPQIVNWKGFDGFFNACLLHRPGRKFIAAPDRDAVGVRFVGMGLDAADRSIDAVNDPRLTTRLRYFTRDTGDLRAFSAAQLTSPADFAATDPQQTLTLSPPRGDLPSLPQGAAQIWRLNDPPLFDRGYWHAAQSGMAGWNDMSGASDAARQALNASADITVPERAFVFRVLAVYLLVLVPLNWSLFWLIGRVEWAWAAAPLIAICGALAVVHYAHLDIGFARSRTEVAVLELQGGHPRGHLTRYMELYTSLSTRYDVYFDNPGALAQPLGDPQFDRRPQPAVSTVTFDRDKQTTLRGFKVESSTTRMLHTEEMRGIGGPIALEGRPHGLRVANNSGLSLQGVGVIRRLPEGEAGGAEAIEVAWIGDLPAKKTVSLQFGPVTDGRALLAPWQDSPITTTDTPDDEVSLVRLLDLARDPRRLLPGDVKLIGWTDEDPGGVTLRPQPSNRTFRMLVVANLQYADLAEPARDVNTLAAEKAHLNSLDLPDQFGN